MKIAPQTAAEKELQLELERERRAEHLQNGAFAIAFLVFVAWAAYVLAAMLAA